LGIGVKFYNFPYVARLVYPVKSWIFYFTGLNPFGVGDWGEILRFSTLFHGASSTLSSALSSTLSSTLSPSEIGLLYIFSSFPLVCSTES
jgi:hypothetical protein